LPVCYIKVIDSVTKRHKTAAYIMKSQTKRNRFCPSELQLELLFLDEGLTEDERKRTQMHLQQCERCRENAKYFETFYSILSLEVAKIVPNQVLDFAKSLSAGCKYGLFICEPIPESINGHGQAYRAKLVFSANGEAGAGVLSDFKISAIPKYHVAMRVMSDSSCNGALICIGTREQFDYHDWKLYIPGVVDQVMFNESGAARVPGVNLEKINNKIVYFDISLEPDSEKSRFQKIKDATLF